MENAHLSRFDQQRLDRLYVRVRAGQSLDYALKIERCTAWFYKALNKADRARVIALDMELEQIQIQQIWVSKVFRK